MEPPRLGRLTAACVLTQVWFPWRYFGVRAAFHLAWVVMARDLLLVALVVVLSVATGTRTRLA